MDFTIRSKTIDGVVYFEAASLAESLDSLAVVAAALMQSGSATTLTTLASRLRKLALEA